MAIIEFVDRDVEAKRADRKKASEVKINRNTSGKKQLNNYSKSNGRGNQIDAFVGLRIDRWIKITYRKYLKA